MQKDNHIVSFLCLSPKTRVLRHFVLQLMIVLVTSFVFLDREKGVISFEPNLVRGWISYFISMNIAMYINLYIVTPKLMLKDKLSSYIFWNLLLITVLVLVVSGLHYYFSPPEGMSKQQSIMFFVVSIFSSYVTYGMLVAGVSAFALAVVWIKDNARMEELEAATLESEMKTLRNQINPHFLFNMLNNANVLLKRDAAKASFILLKLEGLLKHQFNSVQKQLVKLSSEINYLNDFLNLEKSRRDSFIYKIDVEGDVDNVMLPPLLFITFVENAVKHNPDSGASVYLSFRVDDDGLSFVCENSKFKNLEKRDVGGIGMSNIRRRLELLYPTTHSLEVEDKEETYKIKMHIKI
ncbi:MAG TPA: histidine kinase [Paludibacteraceae bacterium]|nr:histidine kinase [Paludibacteraceae bacterium]HPH63526.1 histidine kinase [Paludibacteraceae bacterium]